MLDSILTVKDIAKYAKDNGQPAIALSDHGFMYANLNHVLECKKLGIKMPDVIEPATNCIPEFIDMVKTLLDKGYAYSAGGNIYFDTSKLEQTVSVYAKDLAGNDRVVTGGI